MNRGALALQKKLKERGAKADLAREFEVGPYIVSKWLSGETLPGPVMRARIEDKFKIGWRLWDQPTSEAAA